MTRMHSAGQVNVKSDPIIIEIERGVRNGLYSSKRDKI